VLRWISQGVTVKWNERGPPAPFHHGVSRFSPDEREWLATERDRCLGTGAWERATNFDFVSRAFVVAHNGKRRLVIDLRHLNEHCVKRSCRFESLSRLRKLARRHDFMISVDLTDAYHHIAIRPEDRHYFTFAIETPAGVQYFSTAALNFGWTLSPWVFTTFMKAVVSYLRHPLDSDALRAHLRSSASAAAARGTRTLPWLDDFAFFFRGAPHDSPSYPSMLRAACARRDEIFSLFGRLGLAIAPHKGQHQPSQVLVDHLGYCIDSTRGLFLLTPRREAKLAAAARSLLCAAARGRRLVRPLALASFAGLAQASTLALPLGRFMLRALYDCLSVRRGWRSCPGVRLSRLAITELEWWAALRGSKYIGRAIWRRPDTAILHTDASDLGWGAALNSAAALPPAHGFWTRDEHEWHITCKELVAVRKAVEHFLPQLAGRRVLLREDNQAVVYILTNMVSRSPQLMHELRRLWYLLDTQDIELRAVYIRSAANILADRASRLASPRDYMLDTALFSAAQVRWGQFTVDAFASPATALLPRYWAAHCVEGAEAIDAFAQDWEGEFIWAHPPPGLLLDLVHFLEFLPARAVVCAPTWRGAPWYSLLHQLADDHIELPAGSLQRIAADGPARLEMWPLTLFHIPGGRRTA